MKFKTIYIFATLITAFSTYAEEQTLADFLTHFHCCPVKD